MSATTVTVGVGRRTFLTMTFFLQRMHTTSDSHYHLSSKINIDNAAIRDQYTMCRGAVWTTYRYCILPTSPNRSAKVFSYLGLATLLDYTNGCT